ncbi:hypothetical protein HDU76_003966, partial [Blyttiomyces sp. JEL0837]
DSRNNDDDDDDEPLRKVYRSSSVNGVTRETELNVEYRDLYSRVKDNSRKKSEKSRFKLANSPVDSRQVRVKRRLSSYSSSEEELTEPEPKRQCNSKESKKHNLFNMDLTGVEGYYEALRYFYSNGSGQNGKDYHVGWKHHLYVLYTFRCMVDLKYRPKTNDKQNGLAFIQKELSSYGFSTTAKHHDLRVGIPLFSVMFEQGVLIKRKELARDAMNRSLPLLFGFTRPVMNFYCIIMDLRMRRIERLFFGAEVFRTLSVIGVIIKNCSDDDDLAPGLWDLKDFIWRNISPALENAIRKEHGDKVYEEKIAALSSTSEDSDSDYATDGFVDSESDIMERSADSYVDSASDMADDSSQADSSSPSEDGSEELDELLKCLLGSDGKLDSGSQMCLTKETDEMEDEHHDHIDININNPQLDAELAFGSLNPKTPATPGPESAADNLDIKATASVNISFSESLEPMSQSSSTLKDPNSPHVASNILLDCPADDISQAPINTPLHHKLKAIKSYYDSSRLQSGDLLSNDVVTALKKMELNLKSGEVNVDVGPEMMLTIVTQSLRLHNAAETHLFLSGMTDDAWKDVGVDDDSIFLGGGVNSNM